MTSIHRRINAKGNISHWASPKQLTRYAQRLIREGYRDGGDGRLFNALPDKTNYQEPHYDGDGPTRSEHMNRF